ncbi:uncharacterized protein N7483_009187 [Penicillium malachiteum]|uniref:uncharacterized protein n=1 Tax=Penicillium malachiteum TaxID=1324776 RepID=UPI0025467546|nr:uncharacterized protein N7483_009187 [Penicillium malachiteum]KAJ5721253.1 hypothetical protein N7483_009187 [Penicillium malachiteum]
MDEKLPLAQVAWKQQSRTLPRTRWILLSAVALIGFLFSPYFNLNRIFTKSRSQCHSGKAPTENSLWQPCGEVDGHPRQCASIEVPMDQFDPENSGDKTFTIPLVRIPGKEGSLNLLLNPGGPGGSGFEFVYRRGEQIKALVGDGFHLVSFDPRGVNSSTPTAFCYPDPETRKELSRVRANDASDSPEVYAWSQNFAKACSDTMGEYGKYINTPQTAADMNSILDALGQRDMYYWGFSYGTLLGQTYAAMFPERSKRVIIDGVVNQFDWYGRSFKTDTMVDADSVLDGFFDECMKAGETNCTLSSLATSTDELRQVVFSYLEKLHDQPLSVYINNTAYGLLDYSQVMFNGIFPALYKPRTWFSLAENLYKLIQGNATHAFLAYATETLGDWEHQANEFVTFNDGRTGADHWPQGRQALLEEITPWLNQSLFGNEFLKGYYMKQHWSVPKTHSYVPRKGVETAHPLLILSTTYDPVCPLVSARSANEAFVDSQIVEVKGYGHCSVAVGSVCLMKHVREFLYEGKLPATYTQCEVDSPYFVKPESAGSASITAQRHFEDPEDQKIHLAQLELARDWEFSRRVGY